MPAVPQLNVRLAKPADLSLILEFIRDLAAYERLSHQVAASAGELRRHLFPRNRRPAAECLIAFLDGTPAGFAVYYPNFSTFVGRPGLFLEDLFVRPRHRRRGVGRALWTAVARQAADRGCGRMDWLVLSWNRRAQRFYRSLGARHHPTWTLCRIDGEPLSSYATPKRSAARSRAGAAPQVGR